MNKKQFNNGTNMIIQIMVGLLASLGASIVIMMIGAILLNNEIVGEASITWLTLLVWTVSVLIGTIIQKYAFAVKNILVPCATAMIYFVILIAVKMLFIESGFTGIGQGIAAILAGTLPSVILIARNKSENSKRFRYRTG